MANVVERGVVSAVQVKYTFEVMAAVVGQQNAAGPFYKDMAGHFATTTAYKNAPDLVFQSKEQPNGYNQTLFHALGVTSKYAAMWDLFFKPSHARSGKGRVEPTKRGISILKRYGGPFCYISCLQSCPRFGLQRQRAT